MLHRMKYGAAFICGLVLAACSGGDNASAPIAETSGGSVFTPAVTYTDFALIPNCKEEPVREVRYHACRDSRAIYKAALANAKRQGKPLMVTFGFNKCPYCKVLDADIHNPAKPVTSNRVTQYFAASAKPDAPFTLPTVRLHARSEHGLRLADELGMTKMANDRGWHRVWSPFVVFVNPETGAMASESLWESKEIHCDWAANIAVSLENIGMLTRGEGGAERKRCAKG